MFRRSLVGVIIGTVLIAGSRSILRGNLATDEIEGPQPKEPDIAQLVKDLTSEERTIGQRGRCPPTDQPSRGRPW